MHINKIYLLSKFLIYTSFICVLNTTQATPPPIPQYYYDDIYIPQNKLKPNDVLPMISFKPVIMDFDFKKIMEYLYGLPVDSFISDQTYSDLYASNPAIGFTLKNEFQNQKILFQFVPDRAIFFDLKGIRHELIGVRQVPLTDDFKRYKYEDHSAMSTQFFIIQYLDPKQPRKIKIESALNIKQSLKESIYTDPHTLNRFGVLENKKNILKISEDTQALILFFKNSFDQPTKIQFKLLELNIEKPLQIIDVDVIGDITENIDFIPAPGSRIMNRLSYYNTYDFEKYIKINVVDEKNNGYYDLDIVLQHQLIKPLVDGEKPYEIYRKYRYDTVQNKYVKIHEEKRNIEQKLNQS